MQHKVGRPTVITPTTVNLLVTCFHNGLTVREACWQSGISHEAYYNRLRSDEQFADTMSKAQSDLAIQAKVMLANEVRSGSVSAAKWWLERYKPMQDAQETNQSTSQTVIDPEYVERGIDKLIELREMRKQGPVS